MQRRPLLALSALGLPALAAAPASAAQARVIVGFPPGGTGDYVARTLAEQLRTRRFAGAVIVENRPGGGGVVAVQAIKAATPDGLSLLNTPASTLTILPHTHRKLPFDALHDLRPVASVSDLDFALVCHAQVPARTLREALALAAREPRFALFGTAGIGTMSHVLGTLLARRAGVELVHAPYRGGSPALQDVIGGQIPLAILSLSEALLRAQQEGRVRLLATAGTRRSRFVPDTATIEEAGFKGVAGSDWNLIVAPAATPPEVVERIGQLLLAVTDEAPFATALGRVCIEPLRLPREQIVARLAAEYQAMGKLVRDERITVDS